MGAAPSVDRRKHPRHPLATSVQFHHGMSQREFPGRCVDISKGGMLMYVPAATPLRAGDSVRVTLGSVGRPEFANLGDRPLDATVVRVDRKAMLNIGHVAVGVRFMGS